MGGPTEQAGLVKMGPFRTLALLAILCTTVYALPNDQKDGKAIGIFNVVRFPNDVCNTKTAMNGTCYTAEECSDRDGVATGTCADGFGVCCVILLACGATTSENCTYLSLASTATVAGTSCTYTICPASSTVSRIRLDLTMFTIAAPFDPDTAGSAASTLLTGGALGQCTMDTFQVTGSGGASPVICGSNDGQHMIVDTDGAMCVTAAFSFGLDTATRNYRIHAIQYDRLNEMGGPAGCLQFFTGMEGTVSTFNFATATTSTHLANQDYDVCIRRLADRCAICWSPITSGTTIALGTPAAAATARGTFGLSNAATAIATEPLSGLAAECAADPADATNDSNDYIIIPNGVAGTAATAAGIGNTAAVTLGMDKFCGRYFSATATAADKRFDATICSRVTPFKISVFTDGFEADGASGTAGAVGQAKANEAASGVANAPTGTMGFSLGFAQIGC